MPTLRIIRGVPGAGKSTFAEKCLAATCYEADQYFIRPDGKYDFNARLLKEAHQWCKSQVEQAMRREECDVAVANTFTRKWEMQPYIDLAKQYGYTVSVVRCTGEYRNVHGVPADKVLQMKERFEDFEGEIYV